MRRIVVYAVFLFTLSMLIQAEASNQPAGSILVTARDNPVISASLQRYISTQPQIQKVKVWIYFTDKEVFGESDYKRAVQERTAQFPQRALARKQKVKHEPVDFYDLPVSQNYLRQIESQGAKLAHPSRWLNAASFYVRPEQIEQIASLPFVKNVDLVRKYKIKPDPLEEVTKFRESTPLPSESYLLSYGPSFDQLNQLNVPAVHDLGYDGSGIILAMFDTGYRKDHPAFASAYAESRVLAEYDFIWEDGNTQNETGQDPSYQHSHGTNTWSIAGGEAPGNLYGPAYKAFFLVAKTEWVPAESTSEEDNWAAAAEWVDSIGGDIISSSLGYFGFDDGFSYTDADMNGDVAITTRAADLAAANGILVCNSAGNSGPNPGTITAPADADSIIAAGAVSSTGVIASFSSRGPTFDERLKPELVARGVSTYLAVASTLSYGSGNGTSYSCPLLAGCAALLWSARPTLTNMQVREALIGSADRSGTPDNTYGYGLPNLMTALNYAVIPGDINSDDKVTLADVVFQANYIFKPGAAIPIPVSSADVDCSGSVTLGDVVYMANRIFKAGPPACDHDFF